MTSQKHSSSNPKTQWKCSPCISKGTSVARPHSNSPLLEASSPPPTALKSTLSKGHPLQHPPVGGQSHWTAPVGAPLGATPILRCIRHVFRKGAQCHPLLTGCTQVLKGMCGLTGAHSDALDLACNQVAVRSSIRSVIEFDSEITDAIDQAKNVSPPTTRCRVCDFQTHCGN